MKKCNVSASDRHYEEKTDLELMQQMKQAIDEGYNIEMRKVSDGRYKVMRVEKILVGYASSHSMT